ncbi:MULTISPECIES: anti-sigma factor [unclassified Flavobacterium]|uniref:anti-sigma factor n=1 Tax=unclassified Flavobacterium TaxID=196869 RepID=UPI003F932F11
MKKETLDQVFENLTNQWDTAELDNDHNHRFLKKLKTKKSYKKYFIPLSIAASIIILLGITITFQAPPKKQEFNFASKETKQTDSIFTVIISNELNKIKDKKSPENEKIISDALKQMKLLDNDYNKIIQELKANGENKLIINALISNLQTRISFLQNVLLHIESNEKINKLQNEETL